MRCRITTLLLVPVVTLFLAACQTTDTVSRNNINIKIGTGGSGGVYYPVGRAICQLVNDDRYRHGINCTAEPSRGSVYNLLALRRSEITMGFALSDWQYHAYEGSSKFQSIGANKNLRSVFSLHAESVTLVVRPDSYINSIHDLKRKRVGFGNPGGWSAKYWKLVWSALGNTYEDLSEVAHFPISELSNALCDDKIDAFFVIIGHPNTITLEATRNCQAKVISIDGLVIDKLVSSRSYCPSSYKLEQSAA